MILSYCNPLDGKRHEVKAEITVEHSASSFGQPVVVLEDGKVLDFTSWVGCDYRIVKATKEEREKLSALLKIK